jgi:hypothetical protein
MCGIAAPDSCWCNTQQPLLLATLLSTLAALLVKPLLIRIHALPGRAFTFCLSVGQPPSQQCFNQKELLSALLLNLLRIHCIKVLASTLWVGLQPLLCAVLTSLLYSVIPLGVYRPIDKRALHSCFRLEIGSVPSMHIRLVTIPSVSLHMNFV